jgi:5-hydroxyisourate hydrolase
MSARAGLSTHVLDLTRGRPAAGMTIELWFEGSHVKTVVTNADGRTDAPLIDGTAAAEGADAAAFRPGEYELIFHVGDYFAFARNRASDRTSDGTIDLMSDRAAAQTGGPAEAFLNRVPVRFIIRDTTARYHVPLLCTPWAYSTYRGS